MQPHAAFSARARRGGATLAALVLVMASLLVFASPASAHDELVSTDPVADAEVAELPASLTLTFSGDLLTDAGATEVQVTDASGASLVAGTPAVQANVVTQPLTGGASGAVAVLWRVVSSDGHPISGGYSFSVTAAPTPTPTPTVSPTPTPRATTPTASPSPSTASSTPTPTVAPEPADSGPEALPWILFAVIGVAVLGAILYLLVSRARRARELEEARMAGVSTPADSTHPDPSEPGSDTPSER